MQPVFSIGYVKKQPQLLYEDQPFTNSFPS